ncbi:peptidoglycan-recognition protein SC2-like [Macrosteles quadrilineatus]|uniref:peptidoglycan-recognition protein SC2-like n=1 Tax=Macrosteles quadrilineatus TaxID=74068 RepID=UPI0023E146A4|nr:peptidoglycan-recognition protein SC2-like [Macrosteles quadrilineatus]
MDDKPREKPEDLIKKASKVMQRSDWGARDPTFVTTLRAPVEKVVLTWTGTEQCFTEKECVAKVKELQLRHQQEKGVPDIKHNFLLGGDGALYEGRGFQRLGPKYSPLVDEKHSLSEESIEIAFIDKYNNHPSPILLKVLSECLAFGVEGNFIQSKFHLYWMTEKDVVLIQPAMLSSKSEAKMELQHQ